TVNMGDCNDIVGSGENIYPGATEICGNSVDEDCFDGDRPCGAELTCVDISDSPLETQVQASPANIMFLLDDSWSMDWEFITSESDGLFRDYYYVFDNPGDNALSGRIISVNDRRRYRSQWSGYNKMYYTPTSTYTPWPNHSGPGNLPDADPDNPRSNPTNAGNTFNLSGTYLTLLGGGLQVTMTRENDGTSTCADAVRFRRVSDNAEFVVDNSHAGFNTSGSWNTSSGSNGYDPATSGANNPGYSLYSNNNGNVAEWRPVLPSTGDYEVYAWWTTAGTRASNAPYRIYNGDGTLLDTVRVNQRQNAGQWNLLPGPNADSSFTFTNVTSSANLNIIRAHYYAWDDANTNGSVDNTEIYLVELNGDISYYQFNDGDSDNIVDDGELTLDPTPPASIVPKNEDGNNRTYAQERQNFANWYSFYRRRELTAKAAVGRVIDDMSGVNIGIHAINHDVVQGVLPVKADVGGTIIDDSDTLLSLLYTINSSGYTPLRRGLEAIGRYFDADDGQTGGIGNSPYSSSAGGACQQTFAIVMTDGYYNGGNPYGTIGTGDNADGDNDTIFDGGAFGDSNSNTLADIAMHYYERDLSSSLDDLVPIGGGDTARHQHMVTYTVSFGVSGSIVPSAWPDCPNNCPVWQNPTTNQYKIDDMYHAAVNGRGEYLSAENPQTLVDALNALQQAIEERIGSGASVAVNSQQLSTNTVLFQGLYDTNGWTGDIKAYEVDPNTGVLATTSKWSAHDQLELMA
ncbi:MAG: hypothetical protein JRF60_17665, partial [Deltaproteobacteria bacterium]|nr:hypothetical protein [Deltaproteobacteria bacterium]